MTANLVEGFRFSLSELLAVVYIHVNRWQVDTACITWQRAFRFFFSWSNLHNSTVCTGAVSCSFMCLDPLCWKMIMKVPNV